MNLKSHREVRLRFRVRKLLDTMASQTGIRKRRTINRELD
jgi:hypothetical protein